MKTPPPEGVLGVGLRRPVGRVCFLLGLAKGFSYSPSGRTESSSVGWTQLRAVASRTSVRTVTVIWIRAVQGLRGRLPASFSCETRVVAIRSAMGDCLKPARIREFHPL